MGGIFVWIKRLFVFAWFVVLFFCGAWLVKDNASQIAPIVFGLQLPSLSLGVYICAFIFIGLILGFVSAFLVTQGRLFTKKRELVRAHKEIQNLQSSKA